MKLVPLVVRYGTIAMAIAGVISMALVLRTIRAQEQQIPPPPESPPMKPYPKGIAATGILEALSENVSIGAPISGLVQEMPDTVEVGAKVKAGDPLFRLDDRELQAQLVRQQAAVTVAEANVAVAKAQLVKAQDLLKTLQSVPDQRAISQDDLRDRRNDVAVQKALAAAAEAQLEAAQADVKQAQMLIERLTVVAPRDGTILQINIRKGEFVAPTNRLPPIVLGDLTSLQVRADVDEQNAMRIKPGQKATAYLKSDASKAFPLQFERIEPYVIPKVSLTGASTERVDTRVLQIIYRLKVPEGTSLYVGQQVDVFIEE